MILLQQQIKILPKVAYEIKQFIEFAKIKPIGTPHKIQRLESGLLHVRILLDFFKTDNKRNKDDVRATDFNFQHIELSVSHAVVTRLHKDLAHLTYSRLQQTIRNKPWNLKLFVPPLANACVAFIQHILALKELNVKEQPEWERLLAQLTDIEADYKNRSGAFIN